MAAVRNAEKVSRLQKAFGFVNTNSARVIGAVANQGEKIVNVSRALDQSGKVLGTSLRIVRDSMTMSVIDTAGKSVFTLEAGDVSEDFGDFFYKTLKNIEMFTLFHGAGSMVGKIKGIPKFKPFLTSKGTIPKITNGAMDITGDVTAMYVLHLVDTGKVSLSRKELLELAEQALLYRGAATAVGRYMPKLNQKLAEASEKYALAIKTGVSPKEIARNSKIKDPEKRLEKAKEVLGEKTQWSPEQEQAIGEAHLVGADRPESGVYNYTRAEIAQKTRILKKVGFEKSEIRDLMEHGVVGGERGDAFKGMALYQYGELL